MKDQRDENLESGISAETEETVAESNSAKVLRIRGGGEEETAQESITKASWFENFWYHHKWTVIMVSAFLFIIGVATWQILSRSEPDACVMYAGPAYVNASRQEDVKEALEAALAALREEGKATVQFATVTYNENGTNPSTAMTQFTTELSAGDSGLYILSPHMYEVARNTDVLATLEDVLGYTPENAYDRYAVKLSETGFYKTYLMVATEGGEPVSLLPGDSVICLRKPTFLNSLRGSDKAEEQYALHEELFKALIAYEAE